MEDILHTYHHDLFLSENTTYTQGFYFIVMRLLIIACFSIKGFTPSCRKLYYIPIFARTLSVRNTIIVKHWYSKDSILKQCCPPSIDSFNSSKPLCTAVSLLENSYIFQRDAALLYNFIQLQVSLRILYIQGQAYSGRGC